MLAPVIVDLGPDVGARELQVVVDACNDAISKGVCVPEGEAGGEAARAVATARPADDAVLVVRIEVRLSWSEGTPIVRELEFSPRDPLRERWRSVGLAIATLVGEGEQQRARAESLESAPEPAPPEPEPEPPAAEPTPPPPVLNAAPREVEPEEEEEPEPAAPRVPFEHRPVFIGLGAFTGPGFGDGAWRLGGNLRAGWHGVSGWQLTTSVGYAWRTSEDPFTAAWFSLDAGVGYRLALSDAFSVGAMVFGGAQRARFEVLAAGVSRSEAIWNPRVGLGLDARWRVSPGFGFWAAAEATSPGRQSRLFLLPGEPPIQGSAVDATATVGLGWWLD
jgi:hypothetical protein